VFIVRKVLSQLLFVSVYVFFFCFHSLLQKTLLDKTFSRRSSRSAGFLWTPHASSVLSLLSTQCCPLIFRSCHPPRVWGLFAPPVLFSVFFSSPFYIFPLLQSPEWQKPGRFAATRFSCAPSFAITLLLSHVSLNFLLSDTQCPGSGVFGKFFSHTLPPP